MAVRIPGGLRYLPADLGFNAQVIANGANVTGPVVPWRAALAFDTIIITVSVAPGTPNFVLRANFVGFGGAPVFLVGAISAAAITVADYAVWLKNDVGRGTSSTVNATAIPILGAPFVSIRLDNNDVAPATFTVEALLLQSSE